MTSKNFSIKFLKNKAPWIFETHPSTDNIISLCIDIYSSAQVSTQVRARSGFKNMEMTRKTIYKNRKHALQDKNLMHCKVRSILSFIKPLKYEKKPPCNI